MTASSPPLSGSESVVPSSSLRIVIVASFYNDEAVSGLIAGAQGELRRSAHADASCRVVHVPGAWELPWAALHLARSRQADALVALGAVIRGETDHYRHLARAVSDGLMRVMLDTGIPLGFGLLTTDDEVQAMARSGSGSNKGAEAMAAALALLDLSHTLDGGENSAS